MKSFYRFGRFALMVMALGIGAMTSGCSQIDTGNVGVASTLGKINKEELPPGVYETFSKSVTEVSTKEISLTLENLKPKTANNITMSDFDIDLRWAIAPNAPADIMARFRGDAIKEDGGDTIVGANLVRRLAQDAAFDAVKLHQSSDIHLKGDEIVAFVVRALQERLDKEAGKGSFMITGGNVRSLVVDPRLEQAARDAAVVALQVSKVQQEKQLAIETAARDFERAKGEAASNTIVADSLTPNLIRLREIEAQRAFAGEGTHTVLLNGSSGALINVK